MNIVFSNNVFCRFVDITEFFDILSLVINHRRSLAC